jgi:uncharacterized protein (DUF427 family)
MDNYPKVIVPVGHIEPVPRRIRAMLAKQLVLDTTQALYVWEWPYYPQYYIPLVDVRQTLLVDEQQTEYTGQGRTQLHALKVGDVLRTNAARVHVDSPFKALTNTIRFEWTALDSWFEEDEEVFVHPRNPYTRVDALRSTRSVRIELNGVMLAESNSPIMVFETGLPTRFYLDRTAVNFEHLRLTDTVTACPYKGMTSAYWSAQIGNTLLPDIAWAYDFPSRQLLPIAGMVAFYNEQVDVLLDGALLPRPQTHSK